MKKIFRYFAAASFTLAFIPGLKAQVQGQSQSVTTPLSQGRPDSVAETPELAIFAPLYLDSAFDATGSYRYDKNFPKFINPGLEFYEGAQLALDSLEKEGVHLVVHVYDTRSATRTLTDILGSPEFQKTKLIIGHVVPGEMQQLAAAAARMNIPFVNANFPNDGGITNNPQFIILNSTLKTHCEGIYKYIQRNYATKSLVFFRKKGAQEDRLNRYFTDMAKSTASVPLKIKYVTLDENFDARALTNHLDSNTTTVCIAGSLDEGFGKTLCQSLASVGKSYNTVVIGMPTWDNIDFSAPEFAHEEIVYTTPFYMNPNDSLVKEIQGYFKTKFYSRPSDMVFRGYETTLRFTHQLLHTGSNTLGGALGDKKNRVFDDFEIQPVFLNPQTPTLDYFENKKLYFVKRQDGIVSAVN